MGYVSSQEGIWLSSTCWQLFAPSVTCCQRGSLVTLLGLYHWCVKKTHSQHYNHRNSIDLYNDILYAYFESLIFPKEMWRKAIFGDHHPQFHWSDLKSRLFGQTGMSGRRGFPKALSAEHIQGQRPLIHDILWYLNLNVTKRHLNLTAKKSASRISQSLCTVT